MMLVCAGSVTIASGQNLSGAIDLTDFVLMAIEMPGAWDAANLTFQAADALSGTFQNVFSDPGTGAAETELAIAAAASRWIILQPSVTSGLRIIRVRSGTSGTPVNQTAARTLKFYGRQVD